jgi:hypothetical protein
VDIVYDGLVEKMILKMEETPDLRSHPLKVIMNGQVKGGVNIKSAFKFKELEKKLKGKLLF